MSVQAYAEAALALWGGTGLPRLISHRENAVFEVTLHGARAALRLHRPGYRSGAEITSELDWAAALARAGLHVPQPIPALSGALVQTVPNGGPDVSVTTWIDGAPIGEGGTPLPEGPASVALHFELGALLARMHDASDAWTPGPSFTRPPWDRAALTGPNPAWGRYWQAPGLSMAEVETLLAAREKVDVLLRTATLDTGLIHADALRENVFRSPAGLTLIDFDDSGVGYRLYDLASALSQSIEDPRLQAFADALVAGYCGLRPLPAAEIALLPMFSMLRTFSSAGWVVPRYPPEHPTQHLYRGRAVRMAAAFLNGPPLYSV